MSRTVVAIVESRLVENCVGLFVYVVVVFLKFCLHSTLRFYYYRILNSIFSALTITLGPFFIGNRLLLTGYLFYDRLNV